MVTSAKSSVPTVTDQAAAMQLGQCAKNLATCLAELRTSAQKVEHGHTEALAYVAVHAGSHCSLHANGCKNKPRTLTSFQKDTVPASWLKSWHGQ